MSKNKNKETIANLDNAIKDIKDKKSELFFLVVDSKNIPNSNMQYIYEMARTCKDNGYTVTMLYQLTDEYTKAELYNMKKKNIEIDQNRVFGGVNEWLGERYSSLKHINISTEEFNVGPKDYLFIPESLSSFMFETYRLKVPCKRIVILQNFNYVTDFVPLGVEWKNYGIYDAIASTETQKKLIQNVFPYVNVDVLPPFINEMFREKNEPKKLIVNVIAKDQKTINRIIKPFYWKYPMYKFITFRDLRNFPRERYAEMLQESAFTVWVDDDVLFGYSPLEAIRCNSIVIGKIPENVPEWMEDEEGIINNGFWCYSINDMPDLIAKVIGSWMQEYIPEELVQSMKETNEKYKKEAYEKNLLGLIDSLNDKLVNELGEIKASLLNKSE